MCDEGLRVWLGRGRVRDSSWDLRQGQRVLWHLGQTRLFKENVPRAAPSHLWQTVRKWRRRNRHAHKAVGRRPARLFKPGVGGAKDFSLPPRCSRGT